jgi:hypothetical protein
MDRTVPPSYHVAVMVFVLEVNVLYNAHKPDPIVLLGTAQATVALVV